MYFYTYGKLKIILVELCASDVICARRLASSRVRELACGTIWKIVSIPTILYGFAHVLVLKLYQLSSPQQLAKHSSRLCHNLLTQLRSDNFLQCFQLQTIGLFLQMDAIYFVPQQLRDRALKSLLSHAHPPTDHMLFSARSVSLVKWYTRLYNWLILT